MEKGAVSSLTVAVVTHNSERHVDAMLESLASAASTRTLNVVVVDNASTDRTVERVKRHPGVRVIAAGGNVGYSAAINIARRWTDPGVPFAVLNPDVVLMPGALDRLVDALEEDERVGMVTPRLINEDGTTYKHLRREPSVVGAAGDALFGDRWPGRPAVLSEALRQEQDYAVERDVDWAGGAALVVSARCNATVGSWNAERYFLYAEETDYAARIRDVGLRVRYVPDSTVLHHGAGSGTSPQLLALMSVNRLRYYRSRHCRRAAASYRLALLVRHVVRLRDAGHRRAALALVSRSARRGLPSGDRPAARLLCDSGEYAVAQ